jgi:hypothetical protein
MASDLLVTAVGNSTGLLNQNSGRLDLLVQIRILTKFHHDLAETLNTKVAVNELRFSLVTHMVRSDARLDSYGILKLG